MLIIYGCGHNLFWMTITEQLTSDFLTKMDPDKLCCSAELENDVIFIME